MRATRRFRRAARAALGATLLVAACARSEPSEPLTNGRHAWTIPHVLRIAITGEPHTLNPILTTDTTENAIDRLIFDPLVTVAADGRTAVPILAARVPTQANGDIARDGRTLTYHLRRDVRWHDGVPFTSDDVRFTIDAIRNDANNVLSRTGFTLIDEVRTPDAWTVVVHLRQPFAPIVEDLFGESDAPFCVLPAHLLRGEPNLNHAAFNAHPIGTGPFEFARWTRGDRIELSANPRYALGAPKLTRIIIRTIPDEATVLQELRAHTIDWQFEASPRAYRDLAGFGSVRVLLSARNQYERIEMNLTRPPLDDVRVRRALSAAIDRTRLVKELTFDSASAADQDLPPFSWAHAHGIRFDDANPALAERLLDEAGWHTGPDGFRFRGGRPLTLGLAYNSENLTRRRGIVLVQDMLAHIGIRIVPHAYPAALLFGPASLGGILQSGRYDLGWSGWIAGVDPDNSTLVTCGAIPPHGQNETRLCDPRIDALELQALETFNRTKRKASYQRIEERLAEDLPTLVLWWPSQIQAINPDFSGFAPNPVTETWNAYRWDI